MKRKTLLGIGVAACVVTLLTTQALSQEKEAEKKDRPAGQMPMDPEMMAWIKAGTPGPNHELLQYSVGTWKTVVRHWEGPDTEPAEGGMPFEGIGFVGYDNVQKKFISNWMDSMSTGIMIEDGTYDPAKKEFAFYADVPSPTGGAIKSKTFIRIINSDKHVMTFHHRMPGDDQFRKVMEITYTRADAGKSKRPE
jgi:hypothetical protein